MEVNFIPGEDGKSTPISRRGVACAEEHRISVQAKTPTLLPPELSKVLLVGRCCATGPLSDQQSDTRPRDDELDVSLQFGGILDRRGSHHHPPPSHAHEVGYLLSEVRPHPFIIRSRTYFTANLELTQI